LPTIDKTERMKGEMLPPRGKKKKNLQTLEGEGIANDRHNGQGKKKVPVDSIF